MGQQVVGYMQSVIGYMKLVFLVICTITMPHCVTHCNFSMEQGVHIFFCIMATPMHKTAASSTYSAKHLHKLSVTSFFIVRPNDKDLHKYYM